MARRDPEAPVDPPRLWARRRPEVGQALLPVRGEERGHHPTLQGALCPHVLQGRPARGHARALLRSQGENTQSAMRLEFTADMRFVGQAFEVPVELSEADMAELSAAAAVGAPFRDVVAVARIDADVQLTARIEPVDRGRADRKTWIVRHLVPPCSCGDSFRRPNISRDSGASPAILRACGRDSAGPRGRCREGRRARTRHPRRDTGCRRLLPPDQLRLRGVADRPAGPDQRHRQHQPPVVRGRGAIADAAGPFVRTFVRGGGRHTRHAGVARRPGPRRARARRRRETWSLCRSSTKR